MIFRLILAVVLVATGKEMTMGLGALPPVEVFKQRVAALGQLTQEQCNMLPGAPATFGRQVGPNTINGGYCTAHPFLTPLFWELDLTAGNSGHTCVHVTDADPHYPLWVPDSGWGNIGASNADIAKFYDDANPDQFLLKDTADPTYPAAASCVVGAITHPLHADDAYGYAQPVNGEWVVTKTTPTASKVGNIYDYLNLDGWSPGGLRGYLEIHDHTPVVPDLRGLPQGATILSARGRVKATSLTITTAHFQTTKHTIVDEFDPNVFTIVTDTLTNTGATASSGTVAFVLVGVTGTGNIKIIGAPGIDSANLTTSYAWADMTQLVRAMFADGVWNGPYKNLLIVPADPAYAYDLVNGDAGTEWLGRLMPKFDHYAVTKRANGVWDTLECEVHTKLVEYGEFSIESLEISYQLPGSSIVQKLPCYYYPRLD